LAAPFFCGGPASSGLDRHGPEVIPLPDLHPARAQDRVGRVDVEEQVRLAEAEQEIARDEIDAARFRQDEGEVVIGETVQLRRIEPAEEGDRAVNQRREACKALLQVAPVWRELPASHALDRALAVHAAALHLVGERVHVLNETRPDQFGRIESLLRAVRFGLADQVAAGTEHLEPAGDQRVVKGDRHGHCSWKWVGARDPPPQLASSL